jgi:hypothetical protein
MDEEARGLRFTGDDSVAVDPPSCYVVWSKVTAAYFGAHKVAQGTFTLERDCTLGSKRRSLLLAMEAPYTQDLAALPPDIQRRALESLEIVESACELYG